MGRSLHRLKVRFEGDHARDREQNRRVELGRNQRCGRQSPVVALLEELDERAADFVRSHRQSSVRAMLAQISSVADVVIALRRTSRAAETPTWPRTVVYSPRAIKGRAAS